jgi:superkiller protein 3
VPAAAFTIPEVDITRIPKKTREKAMAVQERIRTTPGDFEAVGELGMYYYSYEFPNAAAECFGYAARWDPRTMKWHYYLGLATGRAGDEPGAIAAFRRATELDPKYGPASVKLADALLASKPAESKRLYRRALELDGNDVTAHYGLGQCAKLEGKRDEALEHYRRAVRIAPRYADAHYAIAMILSAEGLREEANKHLKAHSRGGAPSLSNDPLQLALMRGSEKSFLAMMDDARHLAERGAFDEAIRLLELAIENDASGTTARRHLGTIFGMQQRYAEAATQFRSALEVDPNDLDAKSSLGQALERMGKTDEAERLYREVLAGEPNHATTIMYIGQLLASRSRTDVELRPANGQYRYSLGVALANSGRDKEAIDHLRKAVQILQDHGGVRLTLGQVLARNGEIEEAKEMWMETISISPRVAEAHAGLARIALAEKDHFAAVRWAEKACEITRYENSTHVAILAAAYKAAGRPDDADRLRRQAR